jgi:hypothetical protein
MHKNGEFNDFSLEGKGGEWLDTSLYFPIKKSIAVKKQRWTPQAFKKAKT